MQRIALDRIGNAVEVCLQVERFLAALGLFCDLGMLCIVVGIQRNGTACRHGDLIGGGLDLADLFLSWGDLSDDDAARHQRLQGIDPALRVDALLLRLDLTALAEAFLPQRQRAGKGEVDMRVEPLRIVHRQVAHFKHPMEYALQIQQRNVGGLTALFKEDSYCSQSTVLRSACWHRRRCTGGCRAGWFWPPAPCCTHAPNGPSSHPHRDDPKA